MLGARQDGSRLVAIEVERKFLVAGEGWRSNVAAVRRFRQFYLVGEGKANIRVRIEDDARAWLTIKSAAHGRIRDEFEYSIPLPDALEMSRMAEGWIIEKTRHIVPYEGHDWEVDVFSGDNHGLVIAEVELASANESALLQRESGSLPIPAMASFLSGAARGRVPWGFGSRAAVQVQSALGPKKATSLMRRTMP
jgi:adenylate cyclase